jgi:aryl-phospho-beta-D-glucosidase BglC (GH1 family)
MKKRTIFTVTALTAVLLLPAMVFAQLPSPTYGWNLGNSLEAVPREGSWGRVATQNLINGVAGAGFNTVRIPCAWDTHADPVTHTIDPLFMARVKQVVDWCYAKNLTVIINCHWDGGWLDYNLDPSQAPVGYTVQSDDAVKTKMASYWTQIATTFKDYDDKLLFAAANEPPVKTAEQMAKLLSYYQAFVDAVRATGGNNTSRWLVVQAPQTNITLASQLMSPLPSDATPGRLAVEVHYYDPPQFCLLDTDASWGIMAYFWGQNYHSASLPNRNATWADESYVDSQFQLMNTKFISQGIPVIIGEFEAMKRNNASKFPDLKGADYELHVASRTYFHKYVVDAANAKGLKPIYWDTDGSQQFDWSTGAVLDAANVRALTGGSALPGVVAPTITKQPAVPGSVTSGAALSFTVEASGTYLLYQWSKDGTAITTGGDGATYAISSASAATAGTYKVKVYNSAGTVTSADVIVQVTSTSTSSSSGSPVPSGAGGGGGAPGVWYFLLVSLAATGRLVKKRAIRDKVYGVRPRRGRFRKVARGVPTREFGMVRYQRPISYAVCFEPQRARRTEPARVSSQAREPADSFQSPIISLAIFAGSSFLARGRQRRRSMCSQRSLNAVLVAPTSSLLSSSQAPLQYTRMSPVQMFSRLSGISTFMLIRNERAKKSRSD